MVFIDGDHGITIDDCSRLSRFLESRLDRDKEDFELNVSSHGADQPLKFRRQYVKNIGRSLRVTRHDGSQVTGKIMTVGDNTLTLLVESGKGKKAVSEVSLQFDEIKEAKVVLSFK
jgi:ribosome maturation factor RimP